MRKKQDTTLPKLIVLLPFFLLTAVLQCYSQNPVANFTSNTTSGCSPLFVQFTDQSTGNPFSWSWDLGNGQLSTARNPVGTYSQPGTYTVRLVVKNSAGIDEEIKTNYITVSPSPQASFSANITTSCVPATIQFTDQSTTPPGAGVITDWLWDFGDGNTSIQQNPSHIFTATGFYTISLRIKSTSGCQSFVSIGRYIRVVSGISADFSFSQPGTCQAPFLINFQDQSSGPGTLTYLWSFGNGGPTSTLQNPSSTYAATGTYPVQLNVQSSLGCSGTITKNITITGKTTDFIAPASICIGQTVTFKNNSSPPPLSSSWDFGDGTTSSQTSPTKTFFNGGAYQVKLINNYGNCSDSITKTVNVISQPAVNFTANDSTACSAPFTVKFTDTSPAASTWIWDFGDGGTSIQQNPTHTYTSSGNFNVTLSITLPGGCSNTITKNQFIKIQSTTVGIANVPAGGCIPFTFSPLAAIQSVDSIVSYVWDMGEPGGIYNTQFPTHTYNSVGNYTVTLTVTSQSGCVRTVTVPNGVRTGTHPTVNFSLTPNNVCASTPVQFTDLSITSPGAFVQWLWDFGDSTTSISQNPQHVYVDTGALVVKLIVSNNGCLDSAFQPIRVLPPVAIFGYKLNCNNRTQVTFLDSSLANPIYGPVTYEWRMGDPANTIIFGSTPPVFNYPAIGTYTATLIVTNGPCSYQTTKQIIIADEPAGFTISKNPICKSEVFTLSATTSTPAHIKDYTWSIGTATISDTTRSIQYNLSAYGSYDVTLTLEDINGCFNTQTIANYITVSGPIANFSPNGPGGCVNSTIGFTDLSTPAGAITQWTWNYGDGNQQTYTSPPFNHTYVQTGSYSVSLMIKTTAVCADTITLPNSVIITQPVAAFKGDTIYCPLSLLQFVDTSSGSGLTHTWYFGDGGTSTLQNPTHSYPMGNNAYNVKLVITDMVGCRDSVTKNQYVKIRSPRPAFSMIDSIGVCIPLITSFNFLGTDYQSFYWDFGDGGTGSAQNPSHFYNLYGTFTPKLYLIGPGGCIDSAQSTVKVYDPSTDMQIAASPVSACNTITTNFNLTTLPGFKFKFYFGDGKVDSSQQATLSHSYNSPGVYYPYIIVSDKFGCDAVHYGEPIYVYGAIPLFGKDKKEFCDLGEVFFINYTLNNDPIVSTVWDFGDGNTSTAWEPSHIFSGAGTYLVKLTVSTQNQCTSSYTDTIRVYQTPQLSITGKDTLCINSAEIFNGVLSQPDSTITWQWNFGNGSSSPLQNSPVVYTATGNYTISLTAANKLGCSDTETHLINVVGLPTAVAVTNPLSIISGGSTTLNMNYTGPIVYYNWLPTQNLSCTNCMTPVANPQFTTRYVVQIEDRYGCKNSGEITVQVVCTGQNFFIPNTFSPNGDGSNDVFYLRGTGLFRVKVLRVFNRWGELVFEKREFPVNNPVYGWDGSYKGKKGQADVYVYQLEILCNNGELIKYAGNIALIQ
ncbi:MAG TPA: PKD domain-containing protein [Chitinophagaceae bacterium]